MTTHDVQRNACAALRNLTVNAENKEAIVGAGGLDSVTKAMKVQMRKCKRMLVAHYGI